MDFNNIKNRDEGLFEFSNKVYQVFGTEFVRNMSKIGIDCDRHFENECFKIVPYTSDPKDCTCPAQNRLDHEGKELCMHDIHCESQRTHFLHKPTGLTISWDYFASRFDYSNKEISYEEWQDIVQDCVKSVTREPVEPLLQFILVHEAVNFGAHKITASEFHEKFNEFLKENDWTKG